MHFESLRKSPRTSANSQTKGSQHQRVLTSKLFEVGPNGETLDDPWMRDATIVVLKTSGRILDVRPTNDEDLAALARSDPTVECEEPKADVLDLRGLTILPGFIDTHVHFFLHPYAETSWDDQVTRESTAERTIRAVTHAKRTLMAGFTTVRDLGTEGAEEADLAVRKCIGQRIIPGPRYFCATRAIGATGSYGPKDPTRPSAIGVDGKCGVDVADGVDECVKVVRRHIGAGADWIKVHVYAGKSYYRHRAAAGVTSPKAATTSLPIFSPPELNAIIDAAHALGVKVAAHAINPKTISHLIRAGVDTIEHGFGLDPRTLNLFKDHPNIIWNPTLSALYTTNTTTDSLGMAIKAAFASGIPKIACGGDTGVFPHGDNALEMKLINRCGVNWKEVVKAATWTGWLSVRGSWWDSEAGKAELERYEDGTWATGQECRALDDEEGDHDLGENEVAVGAIKVGFGADLIATSGDLEGDFEGAVDKSSIVFVMKAGVVYKWHRQEVL